MTVPENPDVEVWSPSPEEWETLKRESLSKLGLTYDELKQQAEIGDFSSTEAQMLWIVVGERLGDKTSDWWIGIANVTDRGTLPGQVQRYQSKNVVGSDWEEVRETERMAEELPARLRSVMMLLRDIAADYENMTFTHSEEALTWPIAVVTEEDGEVGVWCAKEDCLLDCHNSRIDIDLENFTATDLLTVLTWHIERNKERVANE